MRGSIGIIAKPVNENLQVEVYKQWLGSLIPETLIARGWGSQPCLAPHLDMLAVLLLCLIFTLLVE